MTSAKDAPRRQGRDRHRHFEGARPAARPADGDVQPEEDACRRRSSSPTSSRRDAPAPRRSSTSPATRTPTRSSTSCARFATRGAASLGIGRSGARCAGDGRRADPRRPRRGRAPARAAREGSQEEQVRPSSTRRKTCSLKCKTALENGQPLRALGLAGEDLAPAARLSVAVGEAAARRDQSRRSGCRRGRQRRRRPPNGPA